LIPLPHFVIPAHKGGTLWVITGSEDTKTKFLTFAINIQTTQIVIPANAGIYD